MGLFKTHLTKDEKTKDYYQRIIAVSSVIEEMSNYPMVDKTLVSRLFKEVERLEKTYLFDDDVIGAKGTILAEKGKLWAFKGDTSKALSILTQAINLDHVNSSARKFKAMLLINDGNSKGALIEAKAALNDLNKEQKTNLALSKAGLLPENSNTDEELAEIKGLIAMIEQST